jgi:hypothetical protein
MFDKKKLNFWRLAVIFIGYTAITILSLWLSPQAQKAAMMNESMANMSKMHLNNVTIYSLVSGSDSKAQTEQPDTSQHHEASSGIKTLGVITTIIIFSLLPLLIFGTIILAIVWIK